MKRKISLGLVAAIAALDSPAQANGAFCAEIREVVAAARETPPFSSFPPPSGMDGRRMLGFAVCGTDSLYGYPRFLCASHTDRRGWSDHVELASWIERCLPQAVRAGEELDDPSVSRPGRRPRIMIGPTYHGIHIDAGDLRFTVERAAHPRVWNVVLTAYPRDRSGEDR
jgi:hypothetical protein